MRTLKGYSNSVYSAAFSHDSARVASASSDNTVKIWDARSGECIQTLTVGKSVYRISFDISGSYIQTEIGTADISALPGLVTLQYHGLALSADSVWVTYRAETVVWVPSEHRPSCSAACGNTISIGVGTGSVWICKVEPNIFQGLGTLY